MPFKIVRNDITKVKSDIIVNSANPDPIYVSGTDLAIYKAAGEAFYGVPEHLKRECRSRISKDMLSVLNEFDNILGRKKGT